MRTDLRRTFISNQQGFSLIELLITLALAGVVMGAIYGVFISSNRSYRTQDNIADAQQRVRVGIDFMVDDIRVAGLDPLNSGNFGIENATATNLRFTSDIDLNGVVDAPLGQERITYAYDAVNRTLRRCLYEGTGSETWQTLIRNVSALTFNYLDGSGNVTGTLADIRQIVIILTCAATDAQGKAINRTLSTQVICRNLFM